MEAMEMTSTDSNAYLAAQILSEGQIVTYRLLSRALKCQSHAAKRMLYDFYRDKTSKKPGSIHATFLITGTQTRKPPEAPKGPAVDNEDTPMQSSPFPSSPPQMQEPEEEPVEQRVVTLVREEHLELLKQKYIEISSMYVYSLAPSSLKNLQILSTVTQRIITEFASEDPLIYNKTYGVIQNPDVKRRTANRLPVLAPTAKISLQGSQKPKAEASKPNATDAKSTSSSVSKPALNAKVEPPATQKKPNKSAPASFKREKSDLFKAFAKIPPKAKKDETGNSAASPAVSRPDTPNNQEDVPMKDASDDDEDVEAPQDAEEKAKSAARQQARREREAKIREMMDKDEDESMEDPEKAAGEEQEADTSMPIDAPAAKAEEEKPTVTVSGGRRRGRRKMTIKKTTRDDDGFIVTKEEPGWESFSEEEPAPPPPKPKFAPQSSSAKGKKGSQKPVKGGGIMSFFGKK